MMVSRVRFRAWYLAMVCGVMWGVASPLSAQVRADSAAFLVLLGVDTIAVERYVRVGHRVEATSVTRTPRTIVRRLVLTLAPDGSVATMAAGPAEGALAPRAPAVAGTIPLVGGFWVPWELVLQRARAADADSTEVTILTGNTSRATPVRRLGRGLFALPNQFGIMMQARVDRAGRLVEMDAGGGSTVERLRWVNLDSLAADFAQADAIGRGLGPLSPRETAQATVHGARVSVAYGRPSLRGRDLDLLAPPGQLWRTGANDASTLTTDRPLLFGELTLPPGTYSVFTIPDSPRWTVIFNRQTGQSGLERDPAQDVGQIRIPARENAPHREQFTIEVRQQGEGGALVFRWGRRSALARFRVGS